MMSKLVDVTSEIGRHAQARRLADDAIRRFPKDARLLASKASAQRRDGRYDRALQTYELALSRFPHNSRLRLGRAAMLRRLGMLDGARRIYEDLVADKPTDVRSKNGLASILIVENDITAALPLIDGEEPRTTDDWRAFYLLALAKQRLGNPAESQKRLTWAVERCPFATERRLFTCALAALATRQGRARQAPRIAPQAERDIGNVIDFRAAAMARMPRARPVYATLMNNLPASLAPVRDEIARSFHIIPGRPQRSKSWIGRTIDNELLMAA
jgi:tetratricopeptide (TPR) repeat protein